MFFDYVLPHYLPFSLLPALEQKRLGHYESLPSSETINTIKSKKREIHNNFNLSIEAIIQAIYTRSLDMSLSLDLYGATVKKEGIFDKTLEILNNKLIFTGDYHPEQYITGGYIDEYNADFKVAVLDKKIGSMSTSLGTEKYLLVLLPLYEGKTANTYIKELADDNTMPIVSSLKDSALNPLGAIKSKINQERTRFAFYCDAYKILSSSYFNRNILLKNSLETIIANNKIILAVNQEDYKYANLLVQEIINILSNKDNLQKPNENLTEKYLTALGTFSLLNAFREALKSFSEKYKVYADEETMTYFSLYHLVNNSYMYNISLDFDIILKEIKKEPANNQPQAPFGSYNFSYSIVVFPVILSILSFILVEISKKANIERMSLSNFQDLMIEFIKNNEHFISEFIFYKLMPFFIPLDDLDEFREVLISGLYRIDKVMESSGIRTKENLARDIKKITGSEGPQEECQQAGAEFDMLMSYGDILDWHKELEDRIIKLGYRKAVKRIVGEYYQEVVGPLHDKNAASLESFYQTIIEFTRKPEFKAQISQVIEHGGKVRNSFIEHFHNFFLESYKELLSKSHPTYLEASILDFFLGNFVFLSHLLYDDWNVNQFLEELQEIIDKTNIYENIPYIRQLDQHIRNVIQEENISKEHKSLFAFLIILEILKNYD